MGAPPATGGPETRTTAAPPVHLIELLWLQPGAKVETATDYFRNRLPPILSRHQGEILRSYQVMATLRGELKPAWINVIRFGSMEDMGGVFKDPDYAKLIPLRDATFDRSQQRMFSVVPVEP